MATLTEELAELETEYAEIRASGRSGVVEWREGSKSVRMSETYVRDLRSRIDKLRSLIARRAIGGSITVDPVR